MNKFLIVLLAICLVSVHAFVKRDAPAEAQNNYIDDLKKQVGDFSAKFQKDFTNTMNPDEIKKNFDQFVKGLNDLFTVQEKKA